MHYARNTETATNWMALYVAIKHHRYITVDEALLAVEGHKKLPPNKKINSLTTKNILMIIKKLNNPKFYNIDKLVKKLQINKYNIVKIYLAYKVGGIHMDNTLQNQENEVVCRFKQGHSTIKIEKDMKISISRIVDILQSKGIMSKKHSDNASNEYEDVLKDAVKKTKYVNNFINSFTVNEIVDLKINTEDARLKTIQKTCQVIYKNDRYLTLVCLNTYRKITVSMSDIIEKKAIISKIKEGSLV